MCPGLPGAPGKPSLVTSLAQTDTSGAARGRRHKCASLRADACGRIPERDGVERLRDYWRLVACGGILSWTLRRVQTNFFLPSLLFGGKLDPDPFLFRVSQLPAFATSPPRTIPSPASSLSLLGTKVVDF